MANEIVEIGSMGIAKLLFPLKEAAPILFYGTLVEKAKSEFEIGEREAANVVDYLGAAGYLAKIDIGKLSMHPVYTLAPKGRELIQKYL